MQSSILDLSQSREQIRMDPAGASPGNFLAQQPVVEIVDAGDNFVDSGNHLITANLYQDGVIPSLRPHSLSPLLFCSTISC